jgi:hypothetical protein
MKTRTKKLLKNIALLTICALALQSGMVWAMEKNEVSNDQKLLEASKNGNLEEVKKAINNGANINAKNNYGATPLHLACYNGYLEIVECLVENKAEINAKNNDGYPPLHLACDKGHLDIVKYLIKNGANINAKDNEGYTPCDMAKKDDIKNYLSKFQWHLPLGSIKHFFIGAFFGFLNATIFEAHKKTINSKPVKKAIVPTLVTLGALKYNSNRPWASLITRTLASVSGCVAGQVLFHEISLALHHK